MLWSKNSIMNFLALFMKSLKADNITITLKIIPSLVIFFLYLSILVTHAKDSFLTIYQ